MINVTVAGRVVKDAELRQAGNSQVCGFSVAADTGFGDKKQAHFFSCSLWVNLGCQRSVVTTGDNGSICPERGNLVKTDRQNAWQMECLDLSHRRHS